MHWRTRLVQPQTLARGGFASLAVPTHRGSTVLFERQADVADDWRHRDKGYTYGLYGTPTALELGARVGQLEGALHTFVVPGGQAAIALVYLALCGAGSHALVPHSAYGPNGNGRRHAQAPGHRGRGLRSAHRRRHRRAHSSGTPRWSGPKAPAR